MGFLFWFLGSRRNNSRRVTRLKSGRPSVVPTSVVKPSPPPVAAPAPAERLREYRDVVQEERNFRIQKAKILNVLFLYNGHDWDAFEVLGIPAGASLALVTQRYQELIRTAEKGQLEFYEAAYQAILKKV